MILELYIFFELVLFCLFIVAFFTRQVMIWVLSALISAALFLSSFGVEYYVSQFNITSLQYNTYTVSNSYPYLAWINGALFLLALVLMTYDIFDIKKSTANSGVVQKR